VPASGENRVCCVCRGAADPGPPHQRIVTWVSVRQCAGRRVEPGFCAGCRKGEGWWALKNFLARPCHALSLPLSLSPSLALSLSLSRSLALSISLRLSPSLSVSLYRPAPSPSLPLSCLRALLCPVRVALRLPHRVVARCLGYFNADAGKSARCARRPVQAVTRVQSFSSTSSDELRPVPPAAAVATETSTRR
jgi:hypothetical protein